jgi:predicted MFS family arabinose efflux permease
MNKNDIFERKKPAWSAVFALAFLATVLTISHVLPVSILTPLARDMQITEGVAGQTVTVATVVAFITSLFIVVVVRNLNRRILLLIFSIVMVISNLLVAVSPNLPMLLLARMLVGLAIGGFWAFNASLALRLVPATSVPKALSMIFGGVALSSLATPMAVYLETIIGWRGVFLCVAALGVLVLIWLFLTVPSLPAQGRSSLANLLRLVQRSQVWRGMVGIILSFTGYIALFTYLRPFLETVPGIGVRELTIILILFGIANVLGTPVAGMLLKWNLSLTLSLAPLLMSLISVGLVMFNQVSLLAAVLVVLWGFVSSAPPLGWSTWLTHTVPDEAESGGSLLFGATQFGVALGAAIGGVAIDRSGALGAVVVSGIILLLCSLVNFYATRAKERKSDYGHQTN